MATSVEDETVLRLVRLALDVAPGEDLGPVDAPLLTRAAQLGVVELVITAGATFGFTESAARLAAATIRAAALRGAEAEAMAWRVHRLLEEADVPALALKGVALASMTGRSPADRAGVDTDVLIRPADWPRANRALIAAGYRLSERAVAPRSRDSLTKLVTFSCNEAAYLGPGGAIDLHWRLGPGHDSRLSTQALLPRAQHVSVAGGSIPTLDPDATLAHVALHGAKDRWLSWRTVVDAHLLVTDGGASWEGAAALVGRSDVVTKARTAVDALLAAPPDAGRLGAVSGDASAERLVSYVRRRAALSPSPKSLAAVTVKALLPPQMLAASGLPRRLWWLMLAAHVGRAASSGVRALIATSGSQLGRRR